MSQFPCGAGQSSQRLEHSDDDTGVITHVTQHLGSAQSRVIWSEVPREEGLYDEDCSKRRSQILEQKVLDNPEPPLCVEHTIQVPHQLPEMLPDYGAFPVLASVESNALGLSAHSRMQLSVLSF